MLKRLIGDFIVYGDPYDMMRQLPIVQKQYDDVTNVMTRNDEFEYYNFKLEKGNCLILLGLGDL